MIFEIDLLTERENRTWIVLTRGVTYENNSAVYHNSRMIKFDMPISCKGAGMKILKNNKKDVAWFFNNVLYDEEIINENNLFTHLINANDVPNEIVNLIPYYEKYFGNQYLPASIQTYETKKIYGH